MIEGFKSCAESCPIYKNGSVWYNPVAKSLCSRCERHSSEHNKSYEDIGREIGKICEQKQKSYGNSFNEAHKILQVLFPNGISVEQYTDMLAIIRIIDKLFRIANNKEAFNEDPYADIAGYGLLGLIKEKKKNESC